MGRHASGCEHSLEERARRDLIARHHIDPELWAAILVELEKRYEGDWQ